MQQHAPKNESKAAIAATPVSVTPVVDVKSIDYKAVIQQEPNNSQALFALIDTLMKVNDVAVNRAVIEALISAQKFAFANWLAEKTLNQYKQKPPKIDAAFWNTLANLYDLYIDTCKWVVYSKGTTVSKEMRGFYNVLLQNVMKNAIPICKLGVDVYEKHRPDDAKDYYKKVIHFFKTAGFMSDCKEVISKGLVFFKSNETVLQSLKFFNDCCKAINVIPATYDETYFTREAQRFLQIPKTMENCRSFVAEMEGKLIPIPVVNVNYDFMCERYGILGSLYYAYGFLMDVKKTDDYYQQMLGVDGFLSIHEMIKEKKVFSNLKEFKSYGDDPRLMQHFADHGYYVFAIEACKKWMGTIKRNDIDQLVTAYHTLTAYLAEQYKMIQQSDLRVSIKQPICVIYSKELIKYYDEIIALLDAADSKYCFHQGTFQYNKGIEAAIASFKKISDQKNETVVAYMKQATEALVNRSGLKAVEMADVKTEEMSLLMASFIKDHSFLNPLRCIALIEEYGAALKQPLPYAKQGDIHKILMCIWAIFNCRDKIFEHVSYYWEAISKDETALAEVSWNNYHSLLTQVNNALYQHNQIAFSFALQAHLRPILRHILALQFVEGLQEFCWLEAGNYSRYRKAYGYVKSDDEEKGLFQSKIAELQTSPSYVLQLAREMYKTNSHDKTVDLLHAEYKRRFLVEHKQEKASLLHRSKLVVQFSKIHLLMQTFPVKEKKKDQKDPCKKNHQAYALLLYVYNSLSILIHYPVDAIFFALKYVIENDGGLVESNRPMIVELAAIMLHPEVNQVFVDHFENHAKTTRQEVIFRSDAKQDKPFVQCMKHSLFFKTLYEAHAGTKVRNFNVYSQAIHDLSKEIASGSCDDYKVDALQMAIILCCGLIRIDNDWSAWYKPFVTYCQAEILPKPYLVKRSAILNAVDLFKKGAAMHAKISAQCSAPRA